MMHYYFVLIKCNTMGLNYQPHKTISFLTGNDIMLILITFEKYFGIIPTVPLYSCIQSGTSKERVTKILIK